MKIWAVANQKGGVGKTTTAVACAGVLAEAGNRVLLIDLDAHGSLTDYFHYNPDTLKRGSVQLFGDFPPRYKPQIADMLFPTSLDSLCLLPASAALATVESNARSRKGLGRRLQRFLPLLEDQFEYVIIDTPPVLGVLLINALAACEHLLLPVQTDFLSIKGLERMLRTLTTVLRTGREELAHTVVPTLVDPASQSAIQGLRDLRATFAPAVSQIVVPIDDNLREASAEGLVPSQYSPYSQGVRAYRKLVGSLCEQTGETALIHPVIGNRCHVRS